MRKWVLVGLLIIFAVMLFGTGEQRVYAFLGTCASVGKGSIYIIDVTDPGSPREVFAMKTEYLWVVGVHVSDDYAYFTAGDPPPSATGRRELLVLDISDIEKPELVGSLFLPESANKITKKDGFLFIANWNSGLSIVDVTVPEAPVLVKTLAVKNYPPGAGVRDVKAYDNLLYLAAMDHVDGSRSGIHIFDISDPGDPQIIGSDCGSAKYARGVFAIALAGDRLFASTIGPPMAMKGLVEVNVSDPSSIKHVGSVVTNCNAFGACVDGDYVYVSTSSSRGNLTSLSLRDGTVAYFKTGKMLLSEDLCVFDNMLYGGFAQDGLMIFDISTPGVPVLIGQFRLPDAYYVVSVLAK